VEPVLVFGLLWSAMAVVSWLDQRAFRQEREWPEASLDEQIDAIPRDDRGLDVSARWFEGPRGKGTRLRIAGVWARLTIRTQGTSGLETGDPVFDRTFRVAGPRAAVLAAMSAATRRALLQLAQRGEVRSWTVGVAAGTLRLDVIAQGSPVEVARAALAVAALLAEPADVPAGLLDNVRRDPQPGARLQSLRALRRDHAGQESTAAAVSSALLDPDPEVRLEAALASGAAGRPKLLAMAADEQVDDSCSARALDGVSAPTLPEVAAILESALDPATQRPRRPFTLRACADALGRLGEDAVPLLARALRARHTAVGLAAVRSLERINTVVAVLPLREAADGDDAEVAAAAARALSFVQGHLTGTAGRVSIAQAEGQLTVVDDPRGRVSEPKAESA
jgi:hypothetical protein